MLSPEKMSHPYQTLPNASKIYKEWNYSVNSTYDGDITIFTLEKRINGKEHSKHVEASSNQKSCFSE